MPWTEFFQIVIGGNLKFLTTVDLIKSKPNFHFSKLSSHSSLVLNGSDISVK